ncbi:hypothetical protein FALBO_10596 [Fusarium albosuccineum]|uniref:Uncharacterized protein n=1 Tax=Fusarium albosuccineum TaxID=1237068 RepID=A0A8H4L5C8_9HYPO|nr:hypothetical protein FALBO_10596 [Fusarium albosuccineum]
MLQPGAFRGQGATMSDLPTPQALLRGAATTSGLGHGCLSQQGFGALEQLSTGGLYRVFRHNLVQEEPIDMRLPLPDSGPVHSFLQMRRYLITLEEPRMDLIEEARRFFYENNSFLVHFDDFASFLNDMLDDWLHAAPVELLVQNLTIRVDRHTRQWEQVAAFIEQACFSYRLSSLQRISFEWQDDFEGPNRSFANGWQPIRHNVDDDGSSTDSSSGSDCSSSSSDTVTCSPSDTDGDFFFLG